MNPWIMWIFTDKNFFASEWFWQMLQTVIFVFSIVLVVRQLKINSDTNVLSTMEQLENKWNSDRMVAARSAICQSFIENERNARISSPDWVVANYFEIMGYFLKRKVLDGEVLWQAYSYQIENYWPILESSVKEFRNTTRDKTWMENFEFMLHEMEKISTKHHVIYGRTIAHLRDFAKGEIEDHKIGRAPLLPARTEEPAPKPKSDIAPKKVDERYISISTADRLPDPYLIGCVVEEIIVKTEKKQSKKDKQ